MSEPNDDFMEILFAKFSESYLSYIKLRRQFETMRMEIGARKKLLADMEKVIANHRQIMTDFMKRWQPSAHEVGDEGGAAK